MIDTSIESMGGGRSKPSTETDQRVMTMATGPLPPWPTRGEYSPDRISLPLTKPSTLSRGTRTVLSEWESSGRERWYPTSREKRTRYGAPGGCGVDGAQKVLPSSPRWLKGKDPLREAVFLVGEGGIAQVRIGPQRAAHHRFGAGEGIESVSAVKAAHAAFSDTAKR